MSRPEARGPVWIIMASGPSQNQRDRDAIRDFCRETGARAIAVNNQAFSAPWADILYSYDGIWWKTYSDRTLYPVESRIIREFQGERLCWHVEGVNYGAKVVRKEQPQEGLGTTGIRTGCNSGHQAVNLAYLRGAQIVILTGFDMQHTNGQRHEHPDHPSPMANFSQGMPPMCVDKFRILAPQIKAAGCRVINATRQTALDCFERMELVDAFAAARPLLNPAMPVTSPAPCGLS